MKKLLAIALMFAVFTPSFSQIKELTGIGVFRIGVTNIEKLDSLCMILKIQKAKDIVSYEKENQFRKLTDSYKYAQIIFDPTSEKAAIHAPWHPDTKRYLISRYEIKDVVLTSFLLTFYQGKLVEIEFKGDLDKVEEIFEAKYGESTSRIKEEPKSFVYTNTGNTIEKTETTIDTKWMNGNILALMHRFNGFTDKANPYVFKYFSISDTIISSELWVKEDQAYKDWIAKKENASTEEKKKRYSDF